VRRRIDSFCLAARYLPARGVFPACLHCVRHSSFGSDARFAHRLPQLPRAANLVRGQPACCCRRASVARAAAACAAAAVAVARVYCCGLVVIFRRARRRL
jgi:hypothetical protein